MQQRMLEIVDELAQFIFALPQLLLQLTEQFIIFAFNVEKIVVGEVAVDVLDLTPHLIPFTIEYKIAHD